MGRVLAHDKFVRKLCNKTQACFCRLAGATITIVLNVDIDGVLEVTTKLFGFFLSKGVSRNNYLVHVRPIRLVTELRVSVSPSNACSTLMASLALVSKYGMSPLEWQKVAALLLEIYRLKALI